MAFTLNNMTLPEDASIQMILWISHRLTRISHQPTQRQVRGFWQWTIINYVHYQNTEEDGAAWADLW